MDAKKALGALITAVGLLLLLYALAGGAGDKAIGSKETLQTEAIAAILGWFAVLVGPALWFGEAPAVIRKAAQGGGKG